MCNLKQNSSFPYLESSLIKNTESAAEIKPTVQTGHPVAMASCMMEYQRLPVYRDAADRSHTWRQKQCAVRGSFIRRLQGLSAVAKVCNSFIS